MKLQRKEQIEELAKFKSDSFLTTSFYLNTDKTRLSKKEILLSKKNLLNQALNEISRMDLDKKKRDSLEKDLEKISRFCDENLGSYSYPGLAVFSCSAQDFWKILFLPDPPPRNRVIFDLNPYVRHLSAILDEHWKMCALTLDRKEVKWYEIFMSEISLVETMVGNVPGKVKEGGWEGYESKRIERHIDALLRDYLKKVAETTFHLFKRNNFDWLLLGCADEYFFNLESLFHPYLRIKIKARLKSGPTTPSDRVLREVSELEKDFKRKDEEKIINHFISELEKGGLAVAGLKDVLKRLNQGEVQTLIIVRGFSSPGRICSTCLLIYLDELRCPACGKKTEKVLDVVDEAVEMAFRKNCMVKHLDPSLKLGRYGKIGAILRYKT